MSAESQNTEVDCGCAPTPREWRSFLRPPFLRPLSRRSAIGLGVIGLATAGFLLAQPAFAADYPSWEDVERAKADEGAKAAEVSRIQGLIAELQAEVARTQAVAQQLAGEYMQAQEAFYAAADRVNLLQSQADAEAAKAVAAAEKAGRLASQLYRTGGDDTSLELFFAGSAQGADDLLARLGALDKVMGVNRAVYTEAITARDTARSLSDQAVVARDERDRLQKIAEEKMIAAQEAANAAQAAAEAAATHLVELQAQLAALQDNTSKTVAAYQEGVEAERRARAAREAAAREEAARRAAEQAAQAPQGGGGGGGGGGSGWTSPHGGYISDSYGPRSSICSNGYCTSGYHRGVDLANGCGAEIYAAHSGTVSLILTDDPGYGNMIKINHGNGYSTGYAHIRPGGFNVGWGQWVEAGQVIAYAGTTGASTGCHLHFEVYENGYAINPEWFYSQIGAWL